MELKTPAVYINRKHGNYGVFRTSKGEYFYEDHLTGFCSEGFHEVVKRFRLRKGDKKLRKVTFSILPVKEGSKDQVWVCRLLNGRYEFATENRWSGRMMGFFAGAYIGCEKARRVHKYTGFKLKRGSAPVPVRVVVKEVK